VHVRPLLSSHWTSPPAAWGRPYWPRIGLLDAFESPSGSRLHSNLVPARNQLSPRVGSRRLVNITNMAPRQRPGDEPQTLFLQAVPHSRLAPNRAMELPKRGRTLS
jgi:hypothetical protein